MIDLSPSNVTRIRRILHGRALRPIRSMVAKLDGQEIASLLAHLNAIEMEVLQDALIFLKKLESVLTSLPQGQMKEQISAMPESSLKSLIADSGPENGAYFLEALPIESRLSLLDAQSRDHRQAIERFLNYPKGSTGRLMHASPFCIPVFFTAQEALEVLRSRAQEESIYYIYCIDEIGKLVGISSLRQLATAPAQKKLIEFVKTDVIAVAPITPQEEAARIVAHYDFIALPVVDEHRKLVGLVTIDDVVDIIQDQVTADLYAQAGLSQDDRVYTPASQSFKKRLPWMLVNLALAALASAVVSLFEGTMHEIIILASLKNIVAGMGGNTAIQALTVVTRGLATGDFSFVSKRRTILKEIVTGSCLGLVTGLAAGGLTFLWKGDPMVSVIICVSMILNSVLASLAGSSIPLLLDRWGRDPATGSGVLATTLMDTFSFFSFLGIAALGLRYYGQ